MVDESFVDTTPIGPDSSSETTELTDGDKKSPYTLTVRLVTSDTSQLSPEALCDTSPISGTLPLLPSTLALEIQGRSTR